MAEMTAKERSALGRIYFVEPSLTQQHMADECNINTIVRRFGLTGQVPVGMRLPQYGDFTGVIDYQSALNAVMAAEKSFSSVPADIRKQFDNDPQKFLEFVDNPANLDKMYELGLAVKPARDVSVAQQPMQPGAEAGAAGAV